VSKEASRYIAELEKLCPQYLEELRGIADGAGVAFLDILALNVRTEINFGLFTQNSNLSIKSDGCTSLGYKAKTGPSFLAQNWDWQIEQSPNIFICHVSQPDANLPEFSMVTEGGVIGKIGLNAKGVGVCLNAIRARGLDRSKLPVHFALRAVLESASKQAAIEKLKSCGVAGSAHILVADNTGATGLECTRMGIKELDMDADGVVIHANNLLLPHLAVDEPPWLADSPLRVLRLQELVREKLGSVHTFDTIFELFKDEKGWPASINRCQVDECELQTLFNIVMDLSAKTAMISFGRPTDITERIVLSL
jgi:isopenicillin-N N-acyltransferase like protein